MNCNLASDHGGRLRLAWAVVMILVVPLVLGGCSDEEPSPAPADAEAGDAEVDAGGMDAGSGQDASMDAGEPDASVDAGGLDAGGLDAGEADAAVGTQLLDNPTFDTSLEGWDLSEPSLAEWDAEDMDGSPSSGSARLTNDSTESESEMVLLRQCFPLPEAGTYEVSASARMLEGQTTTGSVVARVNVYSSTTECTGGFGLTSGRFVTQSAEGWQTSTFTIERDETAVGNMTAVEIGVRKTEDTGEMVVLVDDVRLTLLP